MPMSERAYAALKTAAEWNPSAAQFLLSVLTETPYLVKYKDDAYGLLTLLLVNDVVRAPLFHNASASIKDHVLDLDQPGSLMKLPPFPQEKLADCKIFGDEWRERKISKQEVADALKQILKEF